MRRHCCSLNSYRCTIAWPRAVLANPHDKESALIPARNGHTRVVEALLRGGADVNQADFTGRTPLAAAERSNSAHKRAVIEALRRGGARG